MKGGTKVIVKYPSPLKGLKGEIVTVFEEEGQDVYSVRLLEGRGSYKLTDVVDFERYELIELDEPIV